MAKNIPNRWLIAAAGVLMQIALGAVYAWSVFRIPLTRTYGWTVAEVTVAFELAILYSASRHLAAVFGCVGSVRNLSRSPPQSSTVPAPCWPAFPTLCPCCTSAMAFSAGGPGTRYIVPVATLLRWFPDRRGLITGIAVAGFGAGP